jgi:hypothetical protein
MICVPPIIRGRRRHPELVAIGAIIAERFEGLYEMYRFILVKLLHNSGENLDTESDY